MCVREQCPVGQPRGVRTTEQSKKTVVANIVKTSQKTRTKRVASGPTQSGLDRYGRSGDLAGRLANIGQAIRPDFGPTYVRLESLTYSRCYNRRQSTIVDGLPGCTNFRVGVVRTVRTSWWSASGGRYTARG